MMNRRNLLQLLAASTAMTAVSRLSPVFAQEADARPALRVAVQAMAPTLEPLNSISNVGLRAIDLMFDRPSVRDFKAEAEAPGQQIIVPQLAESVTRIDPMTWEIKIRPNVKLHDGSVLSGADFAATFSPSRIGADTPYPEGKILFGHVAEVVTVNDLTVQLKTSRPDPIMDQRLAAYGGWIVGAKALAEGGPESPKTNPVGAGPYKLNEFVADTRVVFDSHDDYWMGMPAAKSVSIEVVPEAATRVAGVISGEYDIVTNLLPGQISQFDGYDDVEVISVPLDLLHAYFYDTKSAVLSDVRMRQALNYGIDYDMLGQAVWGGPVNRPNGLQTPAFGDLYNPDRTFFNYDPEKAKALLAEAGYAGEEIVLRIISGYYVGSEDAAQIVQAMWSELGINLRLELVENAEQVYGPGADIRMVSAAFRFPDPLGGGVIVAFGPNSAPQQRGYWTPTNGYNETGEELLAAENPAERKRLFQKMLDLFEEDAPATILYAANEIYAKRKAVTFTHYPLYYFDLRPTNFGFAD
jgi:peptide/nickel transport system substrate-binding protein